MALAKIHDLAKADFISPAKAGAYSKRPTLYFFNI
jgi:hypothetical protein